MNIHHPGHSWRRLLPGPAKHFASQHLCRLPVSGAVDKLVDCAAAVFMGQDATMFPTVYIEADGPRERHEAGLAASSSQTERTEQREYGLECSPSCYLPLVRPECAGLLPQIILAETFYTLVLLATGSGIQITTPREAEHQHEYEGLLMHSIEASYRIVTPMFIGDAEQKATSARPPSIKGALRFWWRALNWGRCLDEAGHDEAGGLKRLHEQECELFGRSALEENGKQVGGQGCFLLRVRQPDNLGNLVTDWPVNNTGSGYLGFGLMKTKDNPHREGVREGLEFTLELGFKKGTDQDQIASVREALTTWGLLGGLGSRARRGFGSVTLLSMDGQDQLLDRQGYEAAVEQLLQEGSTLRAWPPFTAFCAHSNFRVLATGTPARRVHDQAGQLYKQHRGQSSNLRGANKVPFGLPLQGVGDQNDRRASPLLFHVQELAGRQYLASVLYLPAVFHDKYPAGHQDPGHFYRNVASFVEQAGD